MNVAGASVEDELESTVQRMTAKDPADRFPNYRTLLQTLRRCRDHVPGGTSVGFLAPEVPVSHQQRQLAPSRMMLIVTSVVCAGLLITVYVALERAKRARSAEAFAPPLVNSTVTSPTNAPRTELPRDHKSIFQRYEPIDFRWGWLPFHAGGPPRLPDMSGVLRRI